jgi:Carboxypeptidase regulatory-like domain/TonB dependent receptor
MNHARFWVLLLAFGHAIAFAQSAELNGRVTDSSGSVLPGVKVAITNTATGAVRDASTNDLGYYAIPQLQPGEYSLKAEKQGFRTIIETGIKLEVDQRATVELTMPVGDLAQEVSVKAIAPLLDTVEPSIGQVIDNRQIVGLPLNGRDYAQLALLSSGTTNPIAGSRAGGFSSGGQRLSANNYLLDGVDNNSLELADAGRSAELVKPSVDAIQEFKVQTNVYSAEYGHGTGAVVNVTIKSGTNAIHGTAFEFLRNEKVDARNFFSSPTAATPEFRRNQYGFAVGGPVIKNRTFLFGDWEGTKIRQQQTTLSSLPTSAERTGDFSIVPKKLIDPTTGLGFANNVVPLSRIDPVAQTLINLYPATQNNSLISNYLYSGPNNEDVTRFDVRLDHTLRETDNIFARVSHYGRTLPAVLSLPAPSFGANGFDGTISGWNTALGWNHIFTPSLITSTRISWGYSRFTRANPASAGKDNLNAKYGIKGGDVTTPGDFSDFTITGYRQLGIGQNNPVDRNSQNRQFVSDTNWTHSRHEVKFGVNTIRPQNNIVNSRGVVGSYTFNGQFTGDGAADFLLGLPSQYLASSAVNANLRGWLLAGYAQDDWKLRPNLTVNLGLRYEIARPFYDTQNRMSNFDQDTDPAHPTLVLASNKGGYDARSLVNTSLNGWEPRIGLAWHVLPNTVIRTGFGIFRTYFEPFGDAQFLIGDPPFAYTVTLASSKTAPAFVLSAGAPAGLLSINNAAGGLQFSSYERNPHRAYAPQWNFNIQHQFAGSWLMEVGYSGERGIHLLNRIDGNFSPPGPGNLNAKRILLSAAIPGTSIVASPLGPVYRHVFNGNSNYHALVSKVEKRRSSGLNLLASFTWSKTLGDTCADSADASSPNCGFQDPLNMRAEKGLDNQDTRLRFVTSLIYELPFGRGRHWGSSINRVFDTVAGGWSAGGIFTARTGLPYTIAVSGNPANTGSVSVINRPNVVGDPSSGTRSLAADFNTAAFTANAQYQYGSLGRNTMSARGQQNLDFVATKTFRLTERFRLDFRFEAFNATNTPPFGAPNATLGTNGFGSITSAGAPRNLQFGLKLLF